MPVSLPYPNPVRFSDGMLKFNLLTSCPTTARWDVYTVAYTWIYGETVQVNGAQTVGWNLRDNKGARVSVGMYYVKVSSGSDKVTLKSIVAP
jgi:hypothetical protein